MTSLLRSCAHALTALTALTVTSFALSAPVQAAEDDAMLSGYDRLEIKAAHRSTLLQGSIWYPASTRTYHAVVGENGVFHGTKVMLGAGVEAGKHPLVVISHGSGGNMDGLGWLSSELAKAGVMVLAVNHPGSTTGDSSPRRSAHFWDRPLDMEAALDTVLGDAVFGPEIDSSHIYTLGFSLGGLSVLQTAGIRLDQEAFAEHCDAKPKVQDCAFFLKGNVDFRKLDKTKFEASYREPRLAGVIAVDPGMGEGFTDKSIRAVDIPVDLINLGTNETLWPSVNVSAQGFNLVGRLKNATYTQIAPAHHFSFLALCKEKGAELLAEEGDDPVCTDPANSDRADVHRRVIRQVLEFIGKTGGISG